MIIKSNFVPDCLGLHTPSSFDSLFLADVFVSLLPLPSEGSSACWAILGNIVFRLLTPSGAQKNTNFHLQLDTLCGSLMQGRMGGTIY